MKVVISTCVGYEKHLDNLLDSLDFSNNLNKIIIVKAKEKEEKIDTYKGMPTICSYKNLYEYTSFNMISRYIDHEQIKDDKYLFLHDTCIALDCDFFWKKLNLLEDETSDLSYFYYLVNKSTHCGQNVGIGGRDFVKKYGKGFDSIDTISKRNAISLENRNAGTGAIKGGNHLCIKYHNHASLSKEGWDLRWGPSSGCWVYPVLELKKCKGSTQRSTRHV